MLQLNKKQNLGTWFVRNDNYADGKVVECYLQAELIPHYSHFERNGYKLQNLAVNLVPTALDHPESLTETELSDYKQIVGDYEWFFDTEGMFNEYDIDFYLSNDAKSVEYYSQIWADRLLRQFLIASPDCPCGAYPLLVQYLREQLEAYIEFCNKKESTKCI